MVDLPPAVPATPVALCELARAVATNAAEYLVEALTATDMVIETKSTSTDMVTEMDRATEVHLVEHLLAARPLDGTIGEEGTDRPGTSGVRWVIDPIDGTTNFVYGIPGFNISVAAELDGQIVAGVVVDPLHGDVFCAALGHGATRNGQPIHCTDRSELATALIGTGFSYESDRRRRQAEVLLQVLPVVRDIRRIGAAAVDLCWVGCGRLDGYYEKGLQYWDHAAGGLVAREAGALVGDLEGNATSEAFTLAAGPALFEPLRVLLAGADAGNA